MRERVSVSSHIPSPSGDHGEHGKMPQNYESENEPALTRMMTCKDALDVAFVDPLSSSAMMPHGSDAAAHMHTRACCGTNLPEMLRSKKKKRGFDYGPHKVGVEGAT